MGDTAYFPYGIRSAEEVLFRVREILNYFVRENVSVAVLACNTASAVSLPFVRQEYPFPIIGVIEAGAKIAVQQTAGGCIAVLATERTVASGAYEAAIARINPAFRTISYPAPDLVNIVEEGWTERDPVFLDEAISDHVRPLIEQGADTVILGCTHFLPLRQRILNLFGDRIKVIDPASETGRQVLELVVPETGTPSANGLPRHRFLVSGDDMEHFRTVGSRILGRDLLRVEKYVPGAVRVARS